jgi:V8-like Glu-specific endopeptidase
MRVHRYCILLLLVACASEEARLEPDPERADIFGDDSRRELYELAPGSVERKAADATAGLLVFSGGFERERDLRVLRGQGLGEQHGLCEGVRFYDQPTMGSCTGFLVGEDILVTAGHCVSESTCPDMAVVFDYAYQSAEDTRFDERLVTFPKSDVYSCKQVLGHGYDLEDNCTTDWAVLQLDRPVVGREPLKLALETPERGVNLFAVGHPSGLPTKIAGNAIVRRHGDLTFGYELDLFGGNSGSPVLDKEGVVRGIHICGGVGDYTDDPAPWNPDFDLADGTCQVPIVCDQYCGRLGTAFDIKSIAPSIRSLAPN